MPLGHFFLSFWGTCHTHWEGSVGHRVVELRLAARLGPPAYQMCVRGRGFGILELFSFLIYETRIIVVYGRVVTIK